VPREYAQQLLALKGRAAGERRIVTILFFDVTGSTAMAETLDPEEVLDVMNGAFEVLVEPICRYGGTLARLMGDGVLAFFGAPIASEDDGVRACRAGLEIVEKARSYGQTLAARRGITGFNVRVGINTGLVVVGEVGSDLRVEYTAMGDAVNVAARMEAAAGPGTVYITDTTYRLVADAFDAEDLGGIALKGKSAPVRAYRLRAATAGRPLPSAGREQPFVGRGDEWRRVEDRLDALRRGEGGVLVVAGPPGAGKSRLVSEVRAGAPAVRWVETCCTSFAQDMSFWSARDLVRAIVGATHTEQADELQELLREAARQAALTDSRRDPDELFGLVADLMGLPLEPAIGELLGQFGPEERRRGAIEAVRLLAAASQGPLVLLWEDLQWVDPSSFEVFEALVDLARKEPVLLVATTRLDAEDVTRRLDEILASAPGERIVLAPLGDGDAASLLRSALKGRAVSDESVGRILRAAGGNALFIQAVAESIIESTGEGDTVDAGVIRQTGIPTSLMGAVIARIDRLPTLEKYVLQTASVLGRVFSGAVLARTVEAEIVGGGLEDALAALCERGLMRRRSKAPESSGEPMAEPLWDSPIPSAPSSYGPEPEYFFEHDLTAEVAYDALLRSQRRRLHRRVGEAMESLYNDHTQELAPILAHHFDRGGADERAYKYWTTAARSARLGFNNSEAVHAYERAIALIKTAGTDVDGMGLHEELGDVLYTMSEYGAALDAYDRALGVGGDRRRLLRKKGEVCEKWGRHDEARSYLEDALTLTDEESADAEVAKLYAALSLTRYHEGCVVEAIALANWARSILEAEGDERGLAETCNNLAILLYKHGDLGASLALHERALDLRVKLRDLYGQAASHNNIGLVRASHGDHDAAIAHFEQSVALFEGLANRHGQARALDNLGGVHERCGDRDRAMDCVRRAVVILADISMQKSDIVPEMWQSGTW